jgi:3-oxoacid CoA-transferase
MSEKGVLISWLLLPDETSSLTPSLAGIPAFFSPSGAGTPYAEGGLPLQFKADGSHEIEIATPPREVHMFHGIEHLLEHAIYPDLSLVKAAKADTRGNLIFRGTARNSNPDCAVAAVCLAEAEEIVEAGEFDPDHVHLPGIYVRRLIHATRNEKLIERLTLQQEGEAVVKGPRALIAKRAAREFRDVSCCGWTLMNPPVFHSSCHLSPAKDIPSATRVCT